MENLTTNPTPEPQNVPKVTSDNYRLTIDELILAASTIINNSTHAEIAPLLSKRGYTPLDMSNAKMMVDSLQLLNEKQKKEYGEQYEATKTYTNDWNELQIIYSEHVELGRIVFKNDLQNYVQLGLQGERKRSFSGFSQQAKQYYNNALKDLLVMDALSKKGITKTELEDTLVLIDKVEKEKFDQRKETGEAQQATKNRDLALDALSEWFGDFKRIALKVFWGKPQLLKILGL